MTSRSTRTTSGWYLPLVVVACLALGCGGASSSPEEDGAEPEAPPPVAFGFVVLADPHLYGSADAERRLEAAAEWIRQNREAEAIELVLVVGDLGSRLDRVQAVLGALPMPWVPVIGDNAIQEGREQAFDLALKDHYAKLASELTGWRKAPGPVANPDVEAESWFQNLAFDHRGVRFVGLDWATRHIGQSDEEQAELHDFDGGTWRWLQAERGTWDKTAQENVVLFSHHPMHDFAFGLGSFSPAEIARVEALLAPHADRVYANFAGHYHITLKETRERGGYDVYVTDATHEDDNTLRLVRVKKETDTYAYEHSLVVVPGPDPNASDD